MNYLAHLYLSADEGPIRLGNFMADSIRGQQYKTYPTAIQLGILLHRHIDSFTDQHPIYRQSKHRLHVRYGHYSGVIMDIFYDHFLASRWHEFHPQPLADYAASFYEYLRTHTAWLPEKVLQMLPFMIGRNWLMMYTTVEGIDQIMMQMNHRTQQRVPMHEAGNELRQYYTEFNEEFGRFFEELRQSCSQFIDQHQMQ